MGSETSDNFNFLPFGNFSVWRPQQQRAERKKRSIALLPG
jgi:hypothetical protein